MPPRRDSSHARTKGATVASFDVPTIFVATRSSFIVCGLKLGFSVLKRTRMCPRQMLELTAGGIARDVHVLGCGHRLFLGKVLHTA